MIYLQMSWKNEFMFYVLADSINFLKDWKKIAQMLSCEFFKISKNVFFKEHLWTTTSDDPSDKENYVLVDKLPLVS